MTIARKPKAEPRGPDPMALIQRGGSPAPGARRITQIALRVPGELLTRLDAARRAEAVPLPRNTWILQAIAEKLEREAG
jgi:hypothetical protein